MIVKELLKGRVLELIEDWKIFKSVVKKIKCDFFNEKIQEIAGKNGSPWELIKRYKLLVIEVIQYNNSPCLILNNL